MAIAPEVGRLEGAALRYREAGKLAQALPLYMQAGQLAEREDADEASKLWNNAGMCALHVHDADTAVTCLRNAIELVTPGHPDRRGRLSRLYSNLTAAYYQGARIREAWDAGRQALMLAEENGSPRAVAQALYNLGLAERYLGAFEEAIKIFTTARRLYQQASAPALAADALHNTGWVHLDRAEVEEAEAALLQARTEQIGLGAPTARIDVELARVSLRRGNWIGALTALLQLIETAESLTEPQTHLQALLVAADAARYDNLETALQYADTALDLALTLGRPPILLDLMPLIIRLRAEADLPLSEQEQALAKELYARRYGVLTATGDRLAAEIR